MRSLLPIIALLPTIFLLVTGWLGFRAGGQVSRAMGPDTRMLYPVQPRRSFIERLVHDEPAAMSARAVRRLGLFLMVVSPIPIGFIAGWHVFSPAHWARQFNSPCAEIIPANLVEERLHGDVDVDVTDSGGSCWAHFKADGETVMRVSIRRPWKDAGFEFEDSQARKYDKEIDEMSEFAGESRVFRAGAHRTTLILKYSGWDLEVELLGKMAAPAAERSVRSSIRKNKRRIRLNHR